MPSLRSTLTGGIATAPRSTTTLIRWALALCAALAAALTPRPATAAPALILPTPPGEPWRIIQGYGCGTHNAWDRYSLDLVQVDGPTYEAPIRAAAGGEIWHWERGSGSLILNHGDRFFTMYTHLSRAVSTERGRYLEAGELLGYAGDRGSPGVPHLHFTAFTANGDGWSGKQSVPLRFAEGYDLPEVGGCSQHQGKVLVGGAVRPPTIRFHSEAAPGSWYRADQRIEFVTEWATEGYATLADAGDGMHTLYVRAWGPDGKQTVASFGPVGFDGSAPAAPPAFGELRSAPGALVVPWQPATDKASGVAGYRVYIGPDQQGTAEWFTAEPLVKTEPLGPGSYVVRVQPIDNVGNKGEWATIGTIVVQAPDSGATPTPTPPPAATPAPPPAEAAPPEEGTKTQEP